MDAEAPSLDYMCVAARVGSTAPGVAEMQGTSPKWAFPKRPPAHRATTHPLKHQANSKIPMSPFLAAPLRYLIKVRSGCGAVPASVQPLPLSQPSPFIYSEMLYLSSPLMLGFNAPAAMPQVRTARTQKQGATSCFIEIRRSRFAELP